MEQGFDEIKGSWMIVTDNPGTYPGVGYLLFDPCGVKNDPRITRPSAWSQNLKIKGLPLRPRP